MNKFLQPNYQFLSNGEKSILYTISLLPPRLYTANYIFSVFDLNSNSEEGVRFFDTLHDLTKKGWLTFTKGAYQLTEVKKKLLYSFREPDQHYFRNLAEKVTKFFARDNNIEKISADEVKNQEQVAANILGNILRPTKQIAMLARNFANYYKRKKAIFLALKYSKIAIELQGQINEYSDDFCCDMAERAVLLNSSGKFNEAITAANECIGLCELTLDNYKQRIAKQQCLIVLATAYEKTRNYSMSLDFAHKAMELGRELKMAATLQTWQIYYNAGISYYHQSEFQNAWRNLVKAYARYCDENNAEPKFFSKLNFRKNFYELRYRICRILKF